MIADAVENGVKTLDNWELMYKSAQKCKNF